MQDTPSIWAKIIEIIITFIQRWLTSINEEKAVAAAVKPQARAVVVNWRPCLQSSALFISAGASFAGTRAGRTGIWCRLVRPCPAGKTPGRRIIRI